VEQIRHVLASMPATTDLERRDRALIAFTIVSGARADALASFRLRHLNLETRMVFQDARGEDEAPQDVRDLVLSGG
jgi:site-specific recombinase XerC